MASLTIRKLDEAIKAYLRLRSAKNGRSVEEEVRVILRRDHRGRAFDFAAARRSCPTACEAPSRAAAARQCATGSGPRHPDHRRRHRRLQVAGPDPAAEGAPHSRPLRADQSRAAIRHAAFGQRAVERARLHRPVRSRERVRRRPYPPGARLRPDRGGAGDRGPDGEDGAGGHADDLASAILLAANRPILLAPAMNPLMWNNAATRRNVAQLQRDGVAMVGPNAGEMAEAGEAGVGRMAEPLEIAAAAERSAAAAAAAPARGKARADHRRPDARADRSGALHRQPLLRQTGLCHRRGGAGRRRRRHPGLRPGRSRRSPRASP